MNWFKKKPKRIDILDTWIKIDRKLLECYGMTVYLSPWAKEVLKHKNKERK